MMKMVVVFNAKDRRSKRKIIRTAASCPGISSISMHDGCLTIVGDFNMMTVHQKLQRKWRCANLVSYLSNDPNTEERERQGVVQTLYATQQANPWFCPPVHNYTCVYESDHNNGCVIL